MNLPPASVRLARTFLQSHASAAWDDIACWTGRVSELSEVECWGALSLAAGLIGQVQSRGEQTAWIAAGSTRFFPPDLEYRGIDCRAVTVIEARQKGALQAADWLLRSGAFALVVIDAFDEPAADSVLGRLARLAEESQTAVVFLTRKTPETPSLGSQISLRAAVCAGTEGHELVVLRDKRTAAATRLRWDEHGPMGLY